MIPSVNSWRQIRLVAAREISTRIRSRAYQISTLAIIALAVGGLLAAKIVPDLFEPDPFRLGLTPATDSQGPGLLQSAQAFDRELDLYTYDSEAAARDALDAGELDSVLVAPDQLLFEDQADTTLESIVRQSLFASRLEERASALGLTLQEAQSLIAPVEVETDTVQAPSSDETNPDAEVGQGVGVLSAIVLLMAISFYGQWVLVGVIEEKSNRVVEVLLAAVAPWELLVGKVVGILLLGLLQLMAGVVAFAATAIAFEGFDAIPDVALAGLGMAVIWLAVGLLLYNFLYAAAGATVNRPEEATSATIPLLLPLMGGYFVGLIYIPGHPDSMLARVLSMFPLTAPLTMPSRIASGGGSPIEVVIALALALLTLAGIIWLAARVYSGGILQSSKVGFLTAFRRARDVRR